MIALIGGVLLLSLIILNILIGFKWIKASLSVHKGISILILILGLLHAAGGIMSYFGLGR
jgi:hypothetical protein